MDYLKTVESNYDEMVVLGDNYYPDKNKATVSGTKTANKNLFVEQKFKDGFELVENINIGVKYLIMGNHDIEDFLLDNCINLRKQMEKTTSFEIMFPFESKPVGKTGCKYIFIDTNLYNLSDKPETCFNTVLGKNAKELKDEQNAFIRRELADSDYSRFIVCAHEPLFSLKTKIDEFTNLKMKPDQQSELVNLLFESKKNITYVCADVHMYQNGLIRDNSGHTIRQIVCGTGGGDKDFYCYPNRNIQFKTCDCKSKTCTCPKFEYILENFMDSFGFVEIIINSDGINHKYIKIDKELNTKELTNKYYHNNKSNVRKYYINYN